MSGPGDWPVDGTGLDGWDALDPALREKAQEYATGLLWALSGRRFGTSLLTVRPCPRDRDGYRAGGVLLRPLGFASSWALAGCGCSGACGCDGGQELCLPGPVAEVVAVHVDGQEVPAGGWRLYDRQLLVRTGGLWPRRQDLALPLTAPGTWGVTYRRGTPVPVAGQIAAGALAAEFVKAWQRDSTCRLSRKVQSATRQGVSVTLVDPGQFIDQGLTGLYEVDLWLRAVNPARVSQPSSTWSPDLPQFRTGR